MVPPLPSHPYSRSHAKREKRKAREHLVGGELHSVAVALSEAIGETEALPLKGDHETTKRKRDEEKREESKIGIGKGRTLGEKARRKQM